jgi:hypothetical protein
MSTNQDQNPLFAQMGLNLHDRTNLTLNLEVVEESGRKTVNWMEKGIKVSMKL